MRNGVHGVSDTEIEAKFYLADPEPLIERLEQHGASLSQPRHLERNWRFDLPDGSLSASGIVFRLRVDPRATLTAKRQRADPLTRDEYELQVDEPETALRLVETLGYRTVAIYEKQRRVYALGGQQVMLDELPFGSFAELECDSVEALEQLAHQLGLEWQARITRSYLALFQGLRDSLQLSFRDATFEDFQRLPPVTAADLGVSEALAARERSG